MNVHPVAVGCVVNGGRGLLVHHNALGLWLPPSGRIEENGVPDDAVKRELREELGLDVELVQWSGLSLEGKIVRQLAQPFRLF
ncbi:TPA: NUDIX domain-containing protein [Candidatus Micrarchaeota archaeon]|nr:NUDIX domain-containing protein [Candidatus Micrarchaeota archaeon]